MRRVVDLAGNIKARIQIIILDFNNRHAGKFAKFVDRKLIYLSGEKLVGCSKTLFISRKYGLPLP